jgi:hypothetical protein
VTTVTPYEEGCAGLGVCARPPLVTAASVAPHMWARVVKNLDRQTHEPPAWAGAPATAMPGRYALLAAAARVVPASTSVLARRALFLALQDSNAREVESVKLCCEPLGHLGVC